MAQNRSGRINEEVMRALAAALRTVKDPRVGEGMVSIVHCQVTGDLKFATVHVSVLSNDPQAEKDVMQGLKSASGYLRRQVAQQVQLRITPELIFKLDHSITRGAEINRLIRQTMDKQPTTAKEDASDD